MSDNATPTPTERKTISGTYIRGADGALYFVPDTLLTDIYRIPNSVSTRTDEFLAGMDHQLAGTPQPTSATRVVLYADTAVDPWAVCSTVSTGGTNSGGT